MHGLIGNERTFFCGTRLFQTILDWQSKPEGKVLWPRSRSPQKGLRKAVWAPDPKLIGNELSDDTLDSQLRAKGKR